MLEHHEGYSARRNRYPESPEIGQLRITRDKTGGPLLDSVQIQKIQI